MNTALGDQITDGMLLWRKGIVLTANPGKEEKLGILTFLSFFILPPAHRSSELLHMWVTSRWGMTGETEHCTSRLKIWLPWELCTQECPKPPFSPFFYGTEKAQMGKISPSSCLNPGSSSFQDLHSVFFTCGKLARREPSPSVQKNSPDENPNCSHVRPCSQAGHLF